MNLTKPQKLIYDMEKYAGGAISVICGGMLIRGKKGTTEIQAAVNELYRLNDALRIRISETDGTVSQKIMEYAEQNIPVLRFESKAEMDSYAEKYVKTPLDFYGNLCEISVVVLPGQYGLLVKLHHIIGDAWSLSLLGTQFNKLLNGDFFEAYSYADYVQTEEKYIQSKRYERDKNFFVEQFKKCDEATYINEKQSDSLNAKRKTFAIDNAHANLINSFAEKNETSAFMLFTVALSAYMNRTKMNAEKFYIGTAVLNRSGNKEQNTVGMFINTVPMLIELDNEKSFSENLSSVEETALSVFRHERYNYGDVLTNLRKEFNFGEKLYDTMISYQNAKVGGADVETTWYHGGEQSESLQIHIDDRDSEGIFRVHYDYLTEKFTGDEIEKIHRHICNLLFDGIANPNKKLHELNILTPEEQQKLLYTFNDTAVEYPKDKCVHQLFEEQVERTPDKTAIVACDKTLTYRELNEEANKIAHSLIEKGIGVGDIVAFMLLRKSYMISTILGILKSGAAYLPIDPDYPQDRIDYMLSDSNAKILITENDIEDLLDNSKTFNPCVSMSSESLCYCIYTSGSTGRPKGTLLTHSNVANYVNINNHNVVHKIIKSLYNSIVSVTTVGFDIFVTESLLPLVNGMKIVLANEEQSKTRAKLNALLKLTPADVIQTTPTKLKALIANDRELDYIKNIKTIILGGEALDALLIEDLKKITNADIFNIYGPTETTVWATNAKIEDNITIGKPIADNKLIENISVISPEEQQKLLYTFNDTAVEYPKDKCVHQLFEEQVKRTPDKTAIIFKDTVLSYFELNELVQKYADILVSLGINKGNVVAVHLERSHRLIVLQLAVLKIGAIFLPVDKRYPIDRIEYMCKDCNVSILVSDDSDDRHIKANVITIDEFEQAVPNKKAATVNNSGICYIIYTSGSTGTPKGCALTGQGLTNFCRNNNTLETLKNRENNVFACVNSVSFDYFIAESLLPLTNGYTTVIFDDNESTIQDEFLKIVSENAVNVVMTTPTRLKIYFSDKSDCDVLKQLTCVCTSGEPLMPELLMQIYEKSPNAQVYNPIGPSECSVWDIGGRLNKDDGIDIHIGKPIANTQIYIVDKYMKICPIGVTGELCIAGDGVGAGYLNRPELTAEKFIDNPFGEGKLYKTGDLAYWREDGNIAYVGRNDFQVKIRGLRIELGEIENAINSVDGISQSVVVVRKDEAGRQLICAFYTGEEKPAKEIRDTIGKRLPKYMLPHIFTHIVEMPLTSSGKLNRKALPEIDLNCIYRDAEHVAPKTQLEKELCGLMKIVLGLDSVGITDNFFDFGGDSLKAIEFVSKAHNEGIYFSLQNVFDYPTVKSLCNFIQGEEVQNVSFADVDFSRINKILEKNSTEFLKVPQKCNVGNILLAGATGFLGIHILADYLDKDSGTAYCLVRGKDNNDSINRLRELLQFYFGDKYAETDRIEVICADLQKDKFGLQDSEYFALAQKVDFVINCAASVKHYGSYKYFYEVNVESVKRLIDFCKYANAKLIHTSTLSVSGNSFGDEFDGYISGEEKHFYESSLYIGQPLDNVYARSKFEAEKAVLDAMADGLNANIMRMGFLANRYSDGKFQKNYESNAFLQRIKGIIELGKVPDYLIKNNLYSEFTPIDEAASAVMTIARHFSAKQTVFHINSTKVVYLGELLQMFNELGFELKIVDGPEFTKALRRTVDKYETEHIFETFINDIDENDQLCYESNIYIENDFTVQYLKLLGFEWSDIDITYIQKYVQYFKRIGYFNEKRLPIL